MIFKTILPGAWELNDKDLSYDLFSLRVPQAWQQVAQAIANEKYQKTGQGYPSVPVYSLNTIINASFPQIIQTVNQSWKHPNQIWIRAKEKVDLSYLPELIKDWLREEFSDYFDIEDKLQKLNSNDWQWDKPDTYSFLNPSANDQGIPYQAIPDYLADLFLKNPQVSFGKDDQYQLTFYRVINTNQGAELMSWPPAPLGEAFISFVINFKLQTVPWRKEPIIYHQLSIRRWINTFKKDKFPYSGVTAYVGDNHRWLDAQKQPFCLMPLPIKYRGKSCQWPRAIKELLKLNDSPLPDLNNLVIQPQYQWSLPNEKRKGLQIAIPYHSGSGGEAPCLAGVSALDLAKIDQAIASRLPVSRVSQATRLKLDKSKKVWWELTQKPKTPMDRPEITTPAVFHSENLSYNIFILWQNQECQKALVNQILKSLSLSLLDNSEITPDLDLLEKEGIVYPAANNCCVKIRTMHLQDLAEKLDIDVRDRKRQEKRVDLIEKRIISIVELLPKPEEGISGALVEIGEKKSFFPPESDPRLALRIGVMQSGYVNQHINPLTAYNKQGEKYNLPAKKVTHRVEKAVSDLLRQFGILPTPLIDLKQDGIDYNTWLTCFLILRRTRKTTSNNKRLTVALMIRVNPVTGTVEGTTSNLFPQWKLYPDLLANLITEKWDPDNFGDQSDDNNEQEKRLRNKENEQQLLNQFLTQCLKDCLNTPIETGNKARVLLMAEAQNARQMLTWLQNPKLPASNLPSEIKLTDDQKQRLSVVRLRLANNGEVPVAIVDDSPGSKTTGLFCWKNVCDDPQSNLLYLSIRQPLETEQKLLKKDESRLDNGENPVGNRRLLEIAVVYSPEIDSKKLAIFVHKLRDRWPYFGGEVSLPLPFPFATLAKEYAVNANDKVESEELEESASEDDYHQME